MFCTACYHLDSVCILQWLNPKGQYLLPTSRYVKNKMCCFLYHSLYWRTWWMLCCFRFRRYIQQNRPCRRARNNRESNGHLWYRKRMCDVFNNNDIEIGLTSKSYFCVRWFLYPHRFRNTWWKVLYSRKDITVKDEAGIVKLEALENILEFGCIF